MAFTLSGRVRHEHTYRVDVLSLYWHFVDAVWMVVFTVVYVIGEMSIGSDQLRPQHDGETVEMPSPTAWPIVLAFGITLVFAGMLTTASVSVLGAILAVCGYVGWFRDVLPHEKHESVPVLETSGAVTTSRPVIARVKLDHARICTGRGFRLRSIPSRRA